MQAHAPTGPCAADAKVLVGRFLELVQVRAPQLHAMVSRRNVTLVDARSRGRDGTTETRRRLGGSASYQMLGGSALRVVPVEIQSLLGLKSV